MRAKTESETENVGIPIQSPAALWTWIGRERETANPDNNRLSLFEQTGWLLVGQCSLARSCGFGHAAAAAAAAVKRKSIGASSSTCKISRTFAWEATEVAQPAGSLAKPGCACREKNGLK